MTLSKLYGWNILPSRSIENGIGTTNVLQDFTFNWLKCGSIID